MELLVVMAIILLLAAMLLPVLSKAQMRSKQATCLGQLKQIGLAHHSFAHEHDSRFPAQVPAGQGGTREHYYDGEKLSDDFYVDPSHWRALSNDLVTPKILKCPADPRQAADQFASLDRENVSYFVGLKARYGDPGSILSGDRNLDRAHAAATGPSQFPGDTLGWTRDLHQERGNLLFADGRAESFHNAALAVALANNQTVAPPPPPAVSLPVPAPSTVPSGAPRPDPQFNSAAYAQSQLQRFFNSPGGSGRDGRPASARLSTEDFVYIEKNHPPRTLGIVAPMTVVLNTASNGPIVRETIVDSNVVDQTVLVVTQAAHVPPRTGQTPETNGAILAEAAPRRRRGWGGWWWAVAFLVLGLAWFWRWRTARDPGEPRDKHRIAAREE